MKIQGHYTFELPIEQLFEALRDERLLRQTIPGSVHFHMSAPTRYDAAMELAVPRFGGHYEGWIDVLESISPTFYRLRAHGTGPGRSVVAEGTVTMEALGPAQSLLRYEGVTDALDDFNRLIQMAAHPFVVRLINRGLGELEAIILAEQHPAGSSPDRGMP